MTKYKQVALDVMISYSELLRLTWIAKTISYYLILQIHQNQVILSSPRNQLIAPLT